MESLQPRLHLPLSQGPAPDVGSDGRTLSALLGCGGDLRRNRMSIRGDTPPGEWAAFLETIPDQQLPRLWAAVMRTMRDRGIIRSGNGPVADIGERLAADLLGL